VAVALRGDCECGVCYMMWRRRDPGALSARTADGNRARATGLKANEPQSPLGARRVVTRAVTGTEERGDRR